MHVEYIVQFRRHGANADAQPPLAPLNPLWQGSILSINHAPTPHSGNSQQHTSTSRPAATRSRPVRHRGARSATRHAAWGLPLAAILRATIFLKHCWVTPGASGAMPGFWEAVADWLGWEPVPGTPEHREALFRAVKAKNDELAKPPEQRDSAPAAQEAGAAAVRRDPAGASKSARRCPDPKRHLRPLPTALPPLDARDDALPAIPSHPLHCRCNLQAKKKLLRRNAQQLLQRLDLGCCPDCPRVQQREAASLQAMAAWHEEWEQVCTLRLQALEQGHPYPPLTLPYLDLQPFLPEGLPEDFPPSIDRCAACQNRLEEVRLQWAGRLQEQRLAGCIGGASAAGNSGRQLSPGVSADTTPRFLPCGYCFTTPVLPGLTLHGPCTTFRASAVPVSGA